MPSLTLQFYYVLYISSAERLAKITILTSNASSTEPSLASPSIWTNRDYREQPYDGLRIIDFKPPILARHVAVFSENDIAQPALSLAEVEIYGKSINAFTFTHKNVSSICF